MDLSVICGWEEEESQEGLLGMEFISVIGGAWEYRGEGNANIVIALPHLRVIRLSKVAVGEWIGGDSSRQRRKVEREVTFANHVFVPLLGLQYVGLLQAVQISSEEIERLNEALRPLRPSYRLHKEVRVPFATAHPDFARIHPYPSHRTDYCIEIKPKQGWWPKHLRHGIQPSHPNLCTYCLNQFLKLKRSKITRRTDYCPLDLFSGVAHRIVGALVALISNPQNNLRIFRDGGLVYGESMSLDSLDFLLQEWIQNDSGDCESLSGGSETSQKEPLSSVSSLIYLLCAALLRPKRMHEGSRFQDLNEPYEKLKRDIGEILSQSSGLNYLLSSGPMEESRSESIKSCLDEASPLPAGSILSRILEIQKLADIHGGIDRIYSLYKKICPTHRKKAGKKMPGYCPLPHMSSAHTTLCHHNTSASDKRGGREDMSCSESCSGDESGSEVESIEGDLAKLEVEWEDEEEETLREDLLLDQGSGGEEESARDKVGRQEAECPSAQCLSEERWLDEMAQTSQLTKEELEELERYLLAATAKDCSIMITFSPVHGPPGAPQLSLLDVELMDSLYSPSIPIYKDSDLLLQDMNGTFHRCRIGVADLDPKPLSCIVKHYLRDRDMLEDYAEYLTSTRPNPSQKFHISSG